MSAEHTLGAVYERGVELRKQAVSLLGGTARRGSELGGNTEYSFNLGRGEYSDGQPPRTLSLELVTRGTFTVRRSSASDEAASAYEVTTIKNKTADEFSASGNLQLKNQIQYPSARSIRVVNVRHNDEGEHDLLQLVDADLDIIEQIIADRQ